MRRVTTAVVSLVVVSAFALGCETSADTSLLDVAASVPTSLVVEPTYFMGDVPCAAVSGAVQSYVAQLYDVTQSVPITLAASPPISCSAGVTFRQVVVGHTYRIKIDGYDVPSSKLIPLGGASSGSRTMVLRDDPNAGPVTPRWETFCKDIKAEADTRLVVTDCEPFTPEATSTGVSVDPRVAMKSATPVLACKKTLLDADGNAVVVGDVESFDVRPDDPALPALLNFPCSDLAPPAFTHGIVPGQTYGFRIEARAEAGGPIGWGTSCWALAKDGLVVEAVCDPLRADGGLDISLEGLLGAQTCDEANVATFDVALAAPSGLTAKGVPCGKSVRFSSLAPGNQAATIVGYRSSGDVALEATCSAVIEPGGVTLATCTPL